MTNPSRTSSPSTVSSVLTVFSTVGVLNPCLCGLHSWVTIFSPYHFARLFRRTTGQSPHQWLLRRRIARAQQLLRSATLPLAQVGLNCGFANQSHFTQVFKRQLGLTPRAYRQAYGIGAGLQHDRTEMEDSGPPLPLS